MDTVDHSDGSSVETNSCPLEEQLPTRHLSPTSMALHREPFTALTVSFAPVAIAQRVAIAAESARGPSPWLFPKRELSSLYAPWRR